MRAVGVGVANALDDGHIPLIPKLLQRCHGRIEADRIIDGQDLLRVDPHHRTVVHVERVGVGDDGIEGIIAPRQLEDHQHVIFLMIRHQQTLLLRMESYVVRLSKKILLSRDNQLQHLAHALAEVVRIGA